MHLQGNIVTILDSNGTAVVQYKYDAWGRPISKTGSMATSLGELNPFRYRGYVYDEETGLYYLRSRFYSSELGRFINSDGVIADRANLFAYCAASPIQYADSDGESRYIAYQDNGINPDHFMRYLSWAIGTGLGIGLVALAVNNGSSTTTNTKRRTKDNLPPVDPDPNTVRKYSVYVLYDDDLVVQYVGRTCHVAARELAHANDPFRGDLTMYVVCPHLTKNEARGLEQILMVFFHTLNPNPRYPLNNQINGISLTNPRWNLYIDAGIRYLENAVNNEYLNLLGR